VPFEKLVEVLQPERDVSRSPLFQVKIEFGYPLLKELELPGLSLSPLRIDNEVVKYDLHLFLTEIERHLVGNIVYAKGLFDAATVMSMRQQLEAVLRKVVMQAEVKLSALTEMLAEADNQHQVMKKADYEESIHQRLRHIRPRVIG
jgi:non-ribosomal peptide synthetase component F